MDCGGSYLGVGAHTWFSRALRIACPARSESPSLAFLHLPYSTHFEPSFNQSRSVHKLSRCSLRQQACSTPGALRPLPKCSSNPPFFVRECGRRSVRATPVEKPTVAATTTQVNVSARVITPSVIALCHTAIAEKTRDLHPPSSLPQPPSPQRTTGCLGIRRQRFDFATQAEHINTLIPRRIFPPAWRSRALLHGFAHTHSSSGGMCNRLTRPPPTNTTPAEDFSLLPHPPPTRSAELERGGVASWRREVWAGCSSWGIAGTG